LVNFFHEEILGYPIAAMDATSLQVLKEEGRRAQIKSYVYCIRGGSPDRKSTVYEYNAVLHKIFLGSWFAGYKGKIHCDAGNVFDDLGETPGILLSYCNAHARRKFEPIAKEAQEAGGSNGAADYAMRVFQKLYMIERYAKIKEMDPEQRKALRQEKSKPLMLEFGKWLEAVQKTVLPKSPLGGAVDYCLNHWKGLTRFLDDGELAIDNNLTEQAIKPFVIARKNFLFSCTVAGARALCIHFSIIRTAMLHNLDPYRYYVALFEAIPHCKNAEDYEMLLPWNIKLEKVRLAA
jgi:transposase